MKLKEIIIIIQEESAYDIRELKDLINNIYFDNQSIISYFDNFQILLDNIDICIPNKSIFTSKKRKIICIISFIYF